MTLVIKYKVNNKRYINKFKVNDILIDSAKIINLLCKEYTNIKIISTHWEY